MSLLLGFVGVESLGAAASVTPAAARTATTKRTTTTRKVTTTTKRPTTSTTRKVTTTTKAPAKRCDAAYPSVCIPPAPPDLDCGDITFKRFTVKAPDPHRLDADKDGIGCES